MNNAWLCYKWVATLRFSSFCKVIREPVAHADASILELKKSYKRIDEYLQQEYVREKYTIFEHQKELKEIIS